MPILDCSVDTCMHYKDNACCLSDILVEGENAQMETDTLCSSFDERKDESYSNSSREPELRLSVDCKAANCVYNEKQQCQAEHIGIAGSGAKEEQETCCASFENK